MIDQFIEIVAGKLKDEVHMSEEMYTGDEIKLTGMKPPPEGFLKNGVYPVPTPAVKPIDHRTNLRMAWLKSGKRGVRNYLSRYVPENKLDKLMTAL